MKVYISTEDLRLGVSAVTAALPVKSDMNYSRAYEFIHIEARDSSVTLSCCNLSMQIETRVPAHIEEEGAALFPGKLFGDIVRMLPDAETYLEDEGGAVRVRSGNVDMRLQSMEASGFLGMEMSGVIHRVRINEAELKHMVGQTAPFSLQDGSRPILGGVLIEVEPESLVMVALDGLRLAKRTAPVENLSDSDTAAEYVVSAKMLESAAKVLENAEDRTAEMEFSKQTILIRTETTVMILRTMEGQFVRYKGMLPKFHDSTARLNRVALIRAVERAYLVAKDDRNNLIKLSFEGDKLIMSVNNEVGRIRDELDISMSGSNILTAFNARYMLDIIKNITDDETVLELTIKPGPCVIRPIEGERYYYLLLPVRLS